MQKTSGFLVAAIASTLLMCTETSDNPADGGASSNSPEYVGTWVGQVPAIPGMLAEAVNLEVMVEDQTPDSTYSLLAWYDSTGDTAMKHIGTWEAVDSVIELTGSDCGLIDTLTRELTPMPDSLCTGPLAIPIDIQVDPLTGLEGWTIAVADLASVGQALNLPMDNPFISKIKLVLVKEQ